LLVGSEDERMSDDDLYDDLDRKLPPPYEEATDRSNSDRSPCLADKETPLPSSAHHCAAAASSSVDRRPKSLVEEVQDLQGRVETLERENSVLRRNMGTLYRTAVAELGRKDAQIEELQRELSNHHRLLPNNQSGGGSGGGGDSVPATSNQQNSD
jgi:hypothetical protein